MKKDSSSLLLLDVNTLLALAWPNHQFHTTTTRYMARHRGEWATCALTQLGFIRLSSNPTIVGVVKTPWEAVSYLAVLTQDTRHTYLDSLPSPSGTPFADLFQSILGTKQVTDAYLLALAARYQAKLLTFDRRLSSLDSTGKQVTVLPEIDSE